MSAVAAPAPSTLLQNGVVLLHTEGVAERLYEHSVSVEKKICYCAALHTVSQTIIKSQKKLPRFATNFLRYKWDGPN